MENKSFTRNAVLLTIIVLSLMIFDKCTAQNYDVLNEDLQSTVLHLEINPIIDYNGQKQVDTLTLSWWHPVDKQWFIVEEIWNPIKRDVIIYSNDPITFGIENYINSRRFTIKPIETYVIYRANDNYLNVTPRIE